MQILTAMLSEILDRKQKLKTDGNGCWYCWSYNGPWSVQRLPYFHLVCSKTLFLLFIKSLINSRLFDAQDAGNCLSKPLVFKFFRESMPPDLTRGKGLMAPSVVTAFYSSLCRHLWQILLKPLLFGRHRLLESLFAIYMQWSVLR